MEHSEIAATSDALDIELLLNEITREEPGTLIRKVEQWQILAAISVTNNALKSTTITATR